MEYKIETANREDLPRILEIYAYARGFMVKTGNPTQWGTTHPPKAQLEEDITLRRLYVVKGEGEIVGVFYFCVEEDPTYAEIFEGSWQENSPYGVIHRIAVISHRKGIANACYDFALKRCKNLRIDTHEDNIPMQRSLAKNGFQKCGTIYLASGDPRIAFQKTIN